MRNIREVINGGDSFNGAQVNPRPQLTIKGFWLEAFGFTTGQPVIIDTQLGG